MRAALALVAAMACAVTSAQAQTSTLSGRVVGADTNAGLTNATVELVGRGLILTTPDGSFRFDDVPVQQYALRVGALGYGSSVRIVDLRTDVVLTIALDIAPLALDSVLVDARLIDVDGRVRDPDRGVQIMDAVIVTDLGHEVRSDQRGDFDIDDVLDGSAVRLAVYAFGYLPADTTLIVNDDDRFEIDLVRDTVVERLIALQTERLVERAGDRLYEYREALVRDDLVRYSPSLNLAQIMEVKFPHGILQRVFCVVVDEEHLRTPDQVWHVMTNYFPQYVERMELLEFAVEIPGVPGRLFMLRIYTRRFFQELITQDRPLRNAAVAYNPVNQFAVCT